MGRRKYLGGVSGGCIGERYLVVSLINSKLKGEGQ